MSGQMPQLKSAKRFIASLCFLVAAMFCSKAAVIQYGYDTGRRLVLVTYTNGVSQSYSYDAAGNLLQRDSFVPGSNLVPEGDGDNDGMDDAWELAYFLTLNRDGTDDFDNDGMTDIDEFLAGTLPNDGNSSLRITRVTPTPGVSALIEWTSVPGKYYVVQYKNSLSAATWSQLPGEFEAVGAMSSTVDNTYSGVIPRFYRVALSTGMTPLESPALSVTRTNNQLFITWPSSASAAFFLESATNLTPVVNWAAVTNSVSDNGTTKTVVFPLNPAERTRFFRLQD